MFLLRFETRERVINRSQNRTPNSNSAHIVTNTKNHKYHPSPRGWLISRTSASHITRIITSWQELSWKKKLNYDYMLLRIATAGNVVPSSSVRVDSELIILTGSAHIAAVAVAQREGSRKPLCFVSEIIMHGVSFRKMCWVCARWAELRWYPTASVLIRSDLKTDAFHAVQF